MSSKTYLITHATIMGILRDLQETSDPDDCVVGNAQHRIQERLANLMQQDKPITFRQEEKSRTEKANKGSISQEVTDKPKDEIEEVIREEEIRRRNQERASNGESPGIITQDQEVGEKPTAIGETTPNP